MSEVNYGWCCALGAVGGVCPSFANMAGYYVTNPSEPLPLLGAWFGIGLYGFIGGVVAVAVGEKKIRGAILAGIAAPAIISNIISGAQSDDTSEKIASLQLFGAAYAQEVTMGDLMEDVAANEIPTKLQPWLGRSIAVDVTLQGASNPEIFIPVTYTGMSTNQSEVAMIAATNGVRFVNVPSWADSVDIAGTAVPLSGEENAIRVVAEARPTFASEFVWALGGDRKYKLKSVDAAAFVDAGLSAEYDAFVRHWAEEAVTDLGAELEGYGFAVDPRQLTIAQSIEASQALSLEDEAAVKDRLTEILSN